MVKKPVLAAIILLSLISASLYAQDEEASEKAAEKATEKSFSHTIATGFVYGLPLGASKNLSWSTFGGRLEYELAPRLFSFGDFSFRAAAIFDAGIERPSILRYRTITYLNPDLAIRFYWSPLPWFEMGLGINNGIRITAVEYIQSGVEVMESYSSYALRTELLLKIHNTPRKGGPIIGLAVLPSYTVTSEIPRPGEFFSTAFLTTVTF